MKPRLALALSLLLLTVACDQGTKRWARATLRPGTTIDLGGGHVQLTLAENRGAFLSLGERLPAGIRFVLFTALVAFGLFAGLAALFSARPRSTYDLTALSLLIGGGIGNLLDRAFRGGAVTDFVVLRAGSLRTGVFNLADVCVTAAVVLMLARGWRAGRAKLRA